MISWNGKDRRSPEEVAMDNCLPSIEVGSEEILREKLNSTTAVFGPTPIGHFLVAEFLDSEGNRLEITARMEKENG